MKKKVPVPIGDLIDLIYAKRAERLELERTVDVKKVEEAALRADIMTRLREQGLGSGRGAAATATITYHNIYKVPTGSWPEFWAWARKDKTGVYVQKRLSAEAIGEQLAAGKRVPGVVAEQVADLSVSKSGEPKGKK
jgi:hypothetical protein